MPSCSAEGCSSPTIQYVRAAARRLRLLSLTVAIAVAAGGCSNKPDGAPPGAKPVAVVRVVPAKGERLERTVERTGDVVPVTAIVVAATVEGPIGACPWREGDRVVAGEVLVAVDRPLYVAEVAAADAALTVAKARLDDLRAGVRPEERAQAREALRAAEDEFALARTNRTRTEHLVERGAAPAEAMDTARVASSTAAARQEAARQELAIARHGATPTALGVQAALVEEATAGRDLAQARLAETVIRAPFDGTVTRVYVRPGDQVSPHAPLLELADLTNLVVRFDVPEANSDAVQVGQTVSVRLDAWPDRSLHATLVRVYPTLDPRLRTRTVEARLTDPPALVPGMFARVTVPVETVEDAVTVPVEALRVTQASARFVFVVEEGRATRRDVVTGVESGGRVQIREGLALGASVVVAGHERLKDGAAVRVGAPTGAGAGKGAPTSRSVPGPRENTAEGRP